MKFLRNLLAAILGFFIAMGILFFMFVAVASVIGEEEKIVIKQNTVLEIDLKETLKDYAPKEDNPFEEIMRLNKNKVGLNQVLNAIENAKEDANIKGISIKGANANAGIAQLQAIRRKLEDFKTSQKFITSYADYYSQKGYYLSSAADSVFINPMGGVDFEGLSSEIRFYKDFEEKTGIKYEVIRHGKYKSAVEPYISDKMSEANREQITSFLTSIWQQMTEEISKSRKKTVTALNKVADELLARTPKLAVENNMADAIIYENEYITKLKHKTQTKGNHKLQTVSIQDYIASGKGRIYKKAPHKIAVLYAQGTIIYGKGNEDMIGQTLMINALQKIKNDSKVKALVLRVNSPGGSVLASEIIWRELELIKKKMPVVVSMGNLAASGGYYISCGANKIYAEPTTITGSIGVFGLLPNFNKLSKEWGINTERVSTNKAPYYSLFQPLSKEYNGVVTESIEDIYNTFVNRVATGRKMTFEQVNAIAQGRVWSGSEALQKGLVDELGSLHDAIVCASELAEIDTYKIKNYPNYKKELEDMFTNPIAKIKQQILEEELGRGYQWYQKLKNASQMEGIQARLPFEMEIK